MSIPSLNTFKSLLTAPEISNDAPRFLFQGWTAASGNRGWSSTSTENGSHDTVDRREWKDLNSAAEIRPHAFSKNRGLSVGDLWDVPNVKSVILSHLRGQSSPLSVFSSWSHDLESAIKWGGGGKDGDVYVSIMDRRNLDSHVMVYHVIELQEAGLITLREGNQVYFEYLVQGPVSGLGLKCVSLESLQRAGVALPKPDKLPWLNEPGSIRARAIAAVHLVLPGKVSTMDIPLFYFLAATFLAPYLSELGFRTIEEIRNWCLVFVGSIRAHIHAPLPNLSDDLFPIPHMIEHLPNACRTLDLLLAMTELVHYVFDVSRDLEMMETLTPFDGSF